MPGTRHPLPAPSPPLLAVIPPAPPDYKQHVVVQPLIEIDGDTATVSSDFLYVQDRDGPLISHFGHYADVLARGADGVWRFRRRAIQTEAVSRREVSTLEGNPGTALAP